ncbi:hypothetical protein ONZ45_g8461 [Pleurotus djamor]|nr:hypothetical protein ONZ45_g8461 [Pleurotus djamor]
MVRFKVSTDTGEKYSQPTIWVGVNPGKLAASTQTEEATEEILALLKQHDITDVDVAYRQCEFGYDCTQAGKKRNKLVTSIDDREASNAWIIKGPALSSTLRRRRRRLGATLNSLPSLPSPRQPRKVTDDQPSQPCQTHLKANTNLANSLPLPPPSTAQASQLKPFSRTQPTPSYVGVSMRRRYIQIASIEEGAHYIHYGYATQPSRSSPSPPTNPNYLLPPPSNIPISHPSQSMPSRTNIDDSPTIYKLQASLPSMSPASKIENSKEKIQKYSQRRFLRRWPQFFIKPFANSSKHAPHPYDHGRIVPGRRRFDADKIWSDFGRGGGKAGRVS